jgi:hypothetical protein
MRCPGCGEDIDINELEENCRKDFNAAERVHFNNLKAKRKKLAFRSYHPNRDVVVF